MPRAFSETDRAFAPRERRALGAVRANGYLDGRGSAGQQVAKAYAQWCWRLKVPLVWFDRRSPRSKYGRLRLDLFTTALRLTRAGQSALKGLGPPGSAVVSPHDAWWESVPLADLEGLAVIVLKTALTKGNAELNRARVLNFGRREPARVLEMSAARLA